MGLQYRASENRRRLTESRGVARRGNVSSLINAMHAYSTTALSIIATGERARTKPLPSLRSSWCDVPPSDPRIDWNWRRNSESHSSGDIGSSSANRNPFRLRRRTTLAIGQAEIDQAPTGIIVEFVLHQVASQLTLRIFRVLRSQILHVAALLEGLDWRAGSPTDCAAIGAASGQVARSANSGLPRRERPTLPCSSRTALASSECRQPPRQPGKRGPAPARTPGHTLPRSGCGGRLRAARIPLWTHRAVASPFSNCRRNSSSSRRLATERHRGRFARGLAPCASWRCVTESRCTRLSTAVRQRCPPIQHGSQHARRRCTRADPILTLTISELSKIACVHTARCRDGGTDESHASSRTISRASSTLVS